MFTIKQYNRNDMGYTAWGCSSFSVERGPGHISIKMTPLAPDNALPKMLEIAGPTYIENAVGKTIDRLDAPDRTGQVIGPRGTYVGPPIDGISTETLNRLAQN